MLDNTSNQLSEFRTKNWVEINDGTRETYNKDSQIKPKTSMLKSSSYDYSDAYILVKGIITIAPVTPPAANANNNKEVVFKISAIFTDCISEINNTQIDYAKNIDVVMPMYNLVEYSDNYSKTSESLWQYYKDEPALTDVGAVKNFHVGVVGNREHHF